MLWIDVAYISVDSAQDVANAIAKFIREGIEDKYIKLPVTTSDESTLIELEICPLGDQSLTENADKSELVQCKTRTGGEVTILLPNPKDRMTMPAGIVVAKR